MSSTVPGPSFLVAGGARCGTTGLVEGLRSHPRVFVTEPKEPHYFALHRIGANFTAPGDAHTINRVAVTDTEAYLSLFPEKHDFLALGDGSVSTMYYHEEAIPKILDMNPSMKLILLLREPVERCYSAHQYMRARGLEPVESFLEAVSREDERRAAGWHHIWHYTAMSRYAEAVAAIQEAIPHEQLGIWFYDELNRDFEATISDVLRFLDVPVFEGEGSDIPRVNISGRPRYRLVHAVLRNATANESARRAVKWSTSYQFRERVRRRVLKSDELSTEAREHLAPQFESDLAQLRTTLSTIPGVSGRFPSWLAAAEVAE